MKPGNLSERMMVPNPAATKDEDSIYAHRVRRCAVFYLLRISAKPPLCKGRWPAGPEGLTIPQSASLTAPFAQGGLGANNIVQSRKESYKWKKDCLPPNV